MDVFKAKTKRKKKKKKKKGKKSRRYHTREIDVKPDKTNEVKKKKKKGISWNINSSLVRHYIKRGTNTPSKQCTKKQDDCGLKGN